MRIGIVGNNLYGQVFTRAVEAYPHATATAICPELGESLEPFAADHNLKTYPDLVEMLSAEKLDAVLLASVTAQHEEQAVLALQAGAHVLVDRPFALSLSACDRMIAQAQASERVLMVGQVLQFWPEYVIARDLIRQGELGQVESVTASRVSGTLNSEWQQRLLHPTYGLGGLEAHIHDIDFINSILGMPARVSAQGRQTSQGTWSQVHTLLKFANGVSAGVEADYNVPLNFPLTMYLRVVGEQGTLVFTFRGALAASQTAKRSLILIKKGADPVELQVPVTDAYGGMLAHFINCAQAAAQPQWGSPQQGRQALEILLAVSNSAACHEIVAL